MNKKLFFRARNNAAECMNSLFEKRTDEPRLLFLQKIEKLIQVCDTNEFSLETTSPELHHHRERLRVLASQILQKNHEEIRKDISESILALYRGFDSMAFSQ